MTHPASTQDAPAWFHGDTAHARESGLDNVAFTAGDSLTFIPGQWVDAIVGRLIVGYLPDAAAVIRRMRNWLRRDRCLALPEMDLPAQAPAEPPAALYADCIRRIHDTARQDGLETAAGSKLAARLRAAVVAAGGTITLPPLTAAVAYLES